MLECKGKKRVSGKNGDVFAEDSVVSGLPAAEIVVVDAREVVVDQRHGVEHFDGASCRHSDGGFASDELASGEAENGSDAFASGEEGVAHGFVDLERFLERNGQVQGFVDGLGFTDNVRREVEG